MIKFLSGIIIFLLFENVSAQPSQGFFINNLPKKNIIIPLSTKSRSNHQKPTATVNIYFNDTIAAVSPYIFGNNTNQWMGQIVTESVLINLLKKLSPGILRYPGGNISNLFFWDASPNNFPKNLPDEIIYAEKNHHPEKNFFGGNDTTYLRLSLANYYKLLQQTNSTGTICVNAGYARYGTDNNPISTAAHYAANWVRYDNGRTKFWEVGNEDYGTWQAGYKIDTTKNKDHQPEITNGELYGKIFKAFKDSMHFAAKEIGATIYVGATIIELPKNSHENIINRNWNEGFFKTAGNTADFFVIHSYYTPYQQNTNATSILASASSVTKEMMNYLHNMCKEYSIEMKPVALTEWNIFAEGNKQQVSYISGMHATLVLGELMKNKYGMACRWDLANGYNNGNDHGMFSKGDEPRIAKWTPRPSFYYMYYFKKILGNYLVSSSVSNNDIVCYPSTISPNKAGIVLINTNKSNQTIKLNLHAFKQKKEIYSYLLTGGKDNGEFSQQLFINGIDVSKEGNNVNIEQIKAFSGTTKNNLTISLPAYSVQYILVEATN